MFTGIIEEVGKVKTIQYGSKSSKITIQATKVLIDTKIGDSISTQGVCLTVTSLYSDGFVVDAMNETLERSTLKTLKPGALVNLERALTLQTRLGGHIVNGHVDGIGTITDIEIDDIARKYTIQTSPNLTKYMVEKGSIAIDGISLTLISVAPNACKVSVIPHTQSETTLYDKKKGDLVNIECDIYAKYVEKLNSNNQTSKLSIEKMKAYGY